MNTKALNVFWTLVLFLFGLNSAQTAFFMISRTTPPGDDGWENGIDHFTVSSSICNQTSEYNCTYFKGMTLDSNSCNCECPTPKTTFALTEGKWPRCLDLGNSQARAKFQFSQYDKPGVKGCSQETTTFFANENSNSNLRVLDSGDERVVSLDNSWVSCEVDRNNSWYFGCNFSRLSSVLHLNAIQSLFTLDKGNSYFTLTVGRTDTHVHLLQGTIINLGISCNNGTATVRQPLCLLFKFEGTINCSVTKSELKTTPLYPKPTSSGQETKPSTERVPRIPIPTRNQIHFKPSVAPAVNKRNSSLVPNSRPDTNDKEQSSDHANFSSLGFITAVTISLLLVVILISLLVARCSLSSKHIHLSTRSEESQGAVAVTAMSNLAFQSDERSGYFTLSLRQPAIYASTYQVPDGSRKLSFHAISNSIDVDPTTGHVYEHLDFSGLNNEGLESLETNADNDPHTSDADNISRLQKYGPINLEQCVYNLVEDLPATCSEEAVNNGASDDPEIVLTSGLHKGDSDRENCPNAHPSKREPLYYLIEEPAQETTGASESHEDLATDADAYCTLDEIHLDFSNATTKC